MSYTDLAAGATTYSDGGPIQNIKRLLPCTYVLHELGGCTFEQDSGEWVTRSPFREDRSPSLRVYGDRLDRWIDFAHAGHSGDVLDLIGLFIDSDDKKEQIEKANLLLASIGDWTGPREGAPKATFDVEAARRYVDSLEGQGASVLAELLSNRKDFLADADPDWLADIFHLEGDEDGLVIPYLTKGNDLVAVKSRRPEKGSITIAAGGTDFRSILYGEHLDVPTKDGQKRIVVLCEGETDVWSGTHALRNSDEYVFLGLPTGAGAYPRQADRLAGRHVILAFDGDAAGRSGLAKWIPALLSVNCIVHVAPIPEGRDLAAVSNVPALLSTARKTAVRGSLGGISILDGQYRRRTTKEPKPISNFTLEIVSSLVTPEGRTTYEVQSNGGDATHTLYSNNLESGKAFKKWAQDHGMAWTGSDMDVTELGAMLKIDSYAAPVREAVNVAGLHDGHFVWPGDSIGPRDVQYLPPIDVAVGKVDLRIQREERIPTFLVDRMRDLHENRVVDPILAWLAVAPLRSLFDRFPILNVTGASGTGKTTLLTRIVGGFSGSYMMSTLTGTTRFAVLAQMQSTNAFPVWFDEYRPGARNATLQELNQLLRDAYAGQASIKGGAGDTWNQVTEFQTSAPVIVSGEDNFRETSHRERMIMVHLPHVGKSIEALDRMPPEGTPSPLAADYLAWLLTQLELYGDPVIHPVGPDHWSDRQRYNLGVLVLGWNLLNGWLQSHGHEALGEADWSMVSEESDTTQESDPVMDAIEWALGEPQLSTDVFADADFVWVNTQTLVRETNRLTDITLPGGDVAVSRLLTSKYDGESVRTSTTGARKRYVRIPIPDQLR